MHHADDIKKAAAVLKRGGLVAFPTETVYGLGANALADAAVTRIYEAKGRPSFNPLIVHVRSLEEAKKYAVFSDAAEKLACKFWPGALTLVLPRRADCALSLLASAGLDTVAMRVPAHPLAQALLAAAEFPIAAPSANRSGRVSPTLAEHVRQELGGRVDMIVDGGACPVGIESTVVDVSTPVPAILRPGSITREELAASIGDMQYADKHTGIKSPGMMEKHYAPSKPLQLNVTELKAGEALLAFGAPLAGAGTTENLSPAGDLHEAAANLFRLLRVLDAGDAKAIAVMPIPEEGLGVAINDRLRRAASGQD